MYFLFCYDLFFVLGVIIYYPKKNYIRASGYPQWLLGPDTIVLAFPKPLDTRQ